MKPTFIDMGCHNLMLSRTLVFPTLKKTQVQFIGCDKN